MSDFGYSDAFSTLVGLLRHRAETAPTSRAFTFLVDGDDQEDVITYAQLDHQARAVAATISEEVGEFDRVLVIYPQGLSYLSALFGCMYAKTLAVPLQPPDPRRLDRTLPKLESIVRDGGVRLVLTTREMLEGAQKMLPAGSPLAEVPWIATDDIELSAAEAWKEPELNADDMAYLQYTSGSTSTPKGVIVTHRNLIHNLTDFDVDYGHDADSVMVTWLPTFHDLGLVYGVFMPVFKGFPCVILDPMSFLARPIRWLRAISKYRGTHSPAPNFAYDICVSKTSVEDRQGLDLSCWKVALNGAEAIRYESEARFVEAFEPFGVTWKTISHAYGMSETTAKISSEPHWWEPEFVWADATALEENRVVDVPKSTENARILASCGTTDTDTTVVIARIPDFAKQPDNHVGEIWVGGTTITQGYWERADATEECYGVELSDTGEGPFFRTGDLGFRRDGRVFVTGRLKDMIIIRGENHYPQDIEWDVQFCHPALRPNSIAAFSITHEGREKVVVVSEAYPDKLANEESVFAAVRESVAEHGIQVNAIQLIAPRTIFKTSSGKIMRGRAKLAWSNNEFQVLADWRLPVANANAPDRAEKGDLVSQVTVADVATRRELLTDHVVHMAADILGLPDDYVEPTRPLRELGFDSVQAVELAEDLGNSIGQRLPATVLFDYPTCEELAEYILEEWFSSRSAPVPSSSSESVSATASSSKKVEEMTEDELEAALMAELGDL